MPGGARNPTKANRAGARRPCWCCPVEQYYLLFFFAVFFVAAFLAAFFFLAMGGSLCCYAQVSECSEARVTRPLNERH
jgi:hypothetical protein